MGEAGDSAKRKKGSKLHLAVNILGNLLTLHVTPVDTYDHAEVGRLTQVVQTVAGKSAIVAYVNQGYNESNAA